MPEVDPSTSAEWVRIVKPDLITILIFNGSGQKIAKDVHRFKIDTSYTFIWKGKYIQSM